MRFTLLAATALGTTLVGLVTGTSPILAAPPTPFDWSGFYLGANVGVAHQAARGTATYPDTTGTANYTFSTAGSAYDTVLYVLDGCGGTELACNDDRVFGDTASRIANLPLTIGQTVIVVVDGYSTNSGNYQLRVQ